MFSPSRRRSLRALVALAVPFAALIGPVAGSAATTPTAASIIKAAKSAVATESGVHIVVHTTSGKTATKVIVDIGKSTGLEVITTGAKKVTITVTRAAVYVQGNAAGLTGIMSLTAAQEKIVGTKAITMKSGTAPYKSFKASLTTPALIAFLPSATGTKLLPVVAGSGNYQLKWTTKGTTSATDVTNVLKLSSAKNTLPQSETVHSSTGGGTTVFSHWGESVNPPAPNSNNLVSYDKVFGKG
jgi:hypothetical protein